MNDTHAPTPQDPPPGTHCTWCGAEYGTPEARRKPRPTPRTPKQTDTGPATRCEWCGVEYPLPDDKS